MDEGVAKSRLDEWKHNQYISYSVHQIEEKFNEGTTSQKGYGAKTPDEYAKPKRAREPANQQQAWRESVQWGAQPSLVKRSRVALFPFSHFVRFRARGGEAASH